MQKSLRQQLWQVSKTYSESLPDIQQVPIRILQHQPISYVSALPQRLLHSTIPDFSSVPALGHHMLDQLQSLFPKYSHAECLAWVNAQGYLCFQPTPTTLAQWLNRILDWPETEINTLPPLAAKCSIALQYVYTRCNQRQQLIIPREPMSGIIFDRLLGHNIPTNCLVSTLVELCDASIHAIDSEKTQPVLLASQQLVEQFLAFEQTDHCRNQTLEMKQGQAALYQVVQIAVDMILRRHWGLQPQDSW